MLPLTAPAAESIWPPRLLKGIDLVPASEESDPTLAKAAESRLSENCDHHRGGAVLFFWKRARTLAPPSHLISAGMCIPQFSASSSSRGFHSLPSLAPPMYRVSEMPWILIHLHFCWSVVVGVLTHSVDGADGTPAATDRCRWKRKQRSLGIFRSINCCRFPQILTPPMQPSPDTPAPTSPTLQNTVTT